MTFKYLDIKLFFGEFCKPKISKYRQTDKQTRTGIARNSRSCDVSRQYLYTENYIMTVMTTNRLPNTDVHFRWELCPRD